MIAAVLAACGSDRTGDTRADIAAEVESATRAFKAAQRALDPEGAIGMLAPEFHMYADGVHLPYDSVVASIRAGFAAARAVEPRFEDLRVLVQGPSAALVSFRFRDSIVMRDGAVVRQRGATTLAWERRPEGWRMVYGHADHYPEGDMQLHHGISYIEFTVRDLAASKRFYGAAFGWTFNDYGPEYAGIVGPDGREIGGMRPGEPVRGGPLPILYSRDLEATLAAVRAAGGPIVTEPFDFPGGRRFHFTDPSGNELAVWTERSDG